MIDDTSRREDGFTIVELIVTVVVTAIFIGAIMQIVIAQIKLNGSTRAYYTADLLAYNNLRSYAYGHAPTWFSCVYASGSPQPMPLINSSVDVPGIPSPVVQTVTATAPYGCGGASTTIGYPIKVVSTVTYGTPGRTITHATYSSY